MADFWSADQPVDSTSAKPGKLSYNDMVAKWRARGYPEAAAMGIADNMMRESGGDPTVAGDKGTSFGLFQHHNERKAALEAFAKEKGVDPSNPDTQIEFADQEMQSKFPSLHKSLMGATDRSQSED